MSFLLRADDPGLEVKKVRALNLLESGLYSDLLLEVECPDGSVKSFSVHKVILCIMSTVWESAIKWVNNGVLRVTQFPYETIRTVIYSMYTLEVEFRDLEHCIGVLEASDFYDMKLLQSMCCKYIQQELTKGALSLRDIINLMNKATLFNVDNLQMNIIAYIEDNTRLVLDSEEFLDLSKDALVTILTKKHYLCPEEYLITTTLRWAANACAKSGSIDSRGYLISNDLMKYLRLDLLTPSEMERVFADNSQVFTGEDQEAVRNSCSRCDSETFQKANLRAGYNENLSSQIYVRCPPVTIVEEFTYIGDPIVLPISSVQLEARYSSINSDITRRYEERFSVTINNITGEFDGPVECKPGAIINFLPPVYLNLTNNMTFQIIITLKKTGFYWKNSNFSHYRPGLIRVKRGIIMDINNSYVKPSSDNEDDLNA